MKPIASNKHFERLLKQFKKISLEQIKNNKYLSRTDKNILLAYFSYLRPPYDVVSNILINKFKQNKYKTHSSIDDVVFSPHINRIWLSYTIEDNNKRYKGKDFKNKTLTFKIHYRFGFYRKKRVACWKVLINWL